MQLTRQAGWEYPDSAMTTKQNKLPSAVREYLSAMGSKGGKTTGKVKARSAAHYRAASLKRWEIWRKANNV